MKLYESYFMSDKILIHKPDLLRSSKVFIIGLSGSGKTTMGKNLANKYHRKYINLDDWFWNIAEKQTGKKLDELIRSKEYNGDKIILEMENRLKSYKGNDIFDGVEIMRFNRDFILSNPIIMMGTSVLISTYRAVMREKYKDPWDENASLFEIIKNKYHDQKVFIEEVQKMRKDILNKNEYIEVKDKEEIDLKGGS